MQSSNLKKIKVPTVLLFIFNSYYSLIKVTKLISLDQQVPAKIIDTAALYRSLNTVSIFLQEGLCLTSASFMVSLSSEFFLNPAHGAPN